MTVAVAVGCCDLLRLVAIVVVVAVVAVVVVGDLLRMRYVAIWSTKVCAKLNRSLLERHVFEATFSGSDKHWQQ